jgi:hypothetical protein
LGPCRDERLHSHVETPLCCIPLHTVEICKGERGCSGRYSGRTGSLLHTVEICKGERGCSGRYPYTPWKYAREREVVRADIPAGLVLCYTPWKYAREREVVRADIPAGCGHWRMQGVLGCAVLGYSGWCAVGVGLCCIGVFGMVCGGDSRSYSARVIETGGRRG